MSKKDMEDLYSSIQDGVYGEDKKKNKKVEWVSGLDLRDNENGEVKTIVNKELAQQYAKRMMRNTYTPPTFSTKSMETPKVVVPKDVKEEPIKVKKVNTTLPKDEKGFLSLDFMEKNQSLFDIAGMTSVDLSKIKGSNNFGQKQLYKQLLEFQQMVQKFGEEQILELAQALKNVQGKGKGTVNIGLKNMQQMVSEVAKEKGYGEIIGGMFEKDIPKVQDGKLSLPIHINKKELSIEGQDKSGKAKTEHVEVSTINGKQVYEWGDAWNALEEKKAEIEKIEMVKNKDFLTQSEKERKKILENNKDYQKVQSQQMGIETMMSRAIYSQPQDVGDLQIGKKIGEYSLGFRDKSSISDRNKYRKFANSVLISLQEELPIATANAYISEIQNLGTPDIAGNRENLSVTTGRVLDSVVNGEKLPESAEELNAFLQARRSLLEQADDGSINFNRMFDKIKPSEIKDWLKKSSVDDRKSLIKTMLNSFQDTINNKGGIISEAGKWGDIGSQQFVDKDELADSRIREQENSSGQTETEMLYNAVNNLFDQMSQKGEDQDLDQMREYAKNLITNKSSSKVTASEIGNKFAQIATVKGTTDKSISRLTNIGMTIQDATKEFFDDNDIVQQDYEDSKALNDILNKVGFNPSEDLNSEKSFQKLVEAIQLMKSTKNKSLQTLLSQYEELSSREQSKAIDLMLNQLTPGAKSQNENLSDKNIFKHNYDEDVEMPIELTATPKERYQQQYSDYLTSLYYGKSITRSKRNSYEDFDKENNVKLLTSMEEKKKRVQQSYEASKKYTNGMSPKDFERIEKMKEDLSTKEVDYEKAISFAEATGDQGGAERLKADLEIKKRNISNEIEKAQQSYDSIMINLQTMIDEDIWNLQQILEQYNQFLLEQEKRENLGQSSSQKGNKWNFKKKTGKYRVLGMDATNIGNSEFKEKMQKIIFKEDYFDEENEYEKYKLNRNKYKYIPKEIQKETEQKDKEGKYKLNRNKYKDVTTEFQEETEQKKTNQLQKNEEKEIVEDNSQIEATNNMWKQHKTLVDEAIASEESKTEIAKNLTRALEEETEALQRNNEEWSRHSDVVKSGEVSEDNVKKNVDNNTNIIQTSKEVEETHFEENENIKPKENKEEIKSLDAVLHDNGLGHYYTFMENGQMIEPKDVASATGLSGKQGGFTPFNEIFNNVMKALGDNSIEKVNIDDFLKDKDGNFIKDANKYKSRLENSFKAMGYGTILHSAQESGLESDEFNAVRNREMSKLEKLGFSVENDEMYSLERIKQHSDYISQLNEKIYGDKKGLKNQAHEVSMGIKVGDQYIGGQIDNMAFDPKNNEIVVTDYKTGALNGKKNTVQAAVYQTMINSMMQQNPEQLRGILGLSEDFDFSNTGLKFRNYNVNDKGAAAFEVKFSNNEEAAQIVSNYAKANDNGVKAIEIDKTSPTSAYTVGDYYGNKEKEAQQNQQTAKISNQDNKQERKNAINRVKQLNKEIAEQELQIKIGLFYNAGQEDEAIKKNKNSVEKKKEEVKELTSRYNLQDDKNTQKEIDKQLNTIKKLIKESIERYVNSMSEEILKGNKEEKLFSEDFLKEFDGLKERLKQNFVNQGIIPEEDFDVMFSSEIYNGARKYEKTYSGATKKREHLELQKGLSEYEELLKKESSLSIQEAELDKKVNHEGVGYKEYYRPKQKETREKLSAVRSELNNYDYNLENQTFSYKGKVYNTTENDTKKLQNFKEIENRKEQKLKMIKDPSSQMGYFSRFANSLKENFNYYFGTGLAYNLVGKVMNSFTQGIQQIKEFDKTMVDLQVVSGKTRKEIKGLMVDYNSYAKELGATTQEVASAANEFMRMGYNAEASSKLIKDSMMLSKLGMIESAQATEYLISSIKGYNVALEDSTKIVDMATGLDMKYAVSAGYILEAMSRTAASANLAGVDMSELQSIIAITGETTQKEASVIGESLKTAFARYGNLKASAFISSDIDTESAENSENSDEYTKVNDIEKVLTKQGINVRESDLKTWRSYSDILDDIGKKWKTYSDYEKNAITTAMFGTRQRENGIVMLENYNRILDANKIAISSVGTASKKMEAYNNGLEAATNRVTAAWEGFVQSLSANGFLKGTSQILAEIIENLKTILIVGGTAFAIFKANSLVSTFGSFSNKFADKIYRGQNFAKNVQTKGFWSGIKDSVKQSWGKVEEDASILQEIRDETQQKYDPAKDQNLNDNEKWQAQETKQTNGFLQQILEAINVIKSKLGLGENTGDNIEGNINNVPTKKPYEKPIAVNDKNNNAVLVNDVDGENININNNGEYINKKRDFVSEYQSAKTPQEKRAITLAAKKELGENSDEYLNFQKNKKIDNRNISMYESQMPNQIAKKDQSKADAKEYIERNQQGQAWLAKKRANKAQGKARAIEIAKERANERAVEEEANAVAEQHEKQEMYKEHPQKLTRKQQKELKKVLKIKNENQEKYKPNNNKYKLNKNKYKDVTAEEREYQRMLAEEAAEEEANAVAAQREMESSNQFYHDEKQKMYDDLFGGTNKEQPKQKPKLQNIGNKVKNGLNKSKNSKYIGNGTAGGNALLTLGSMTGMMGGSMVGSQIATAIGGDSSTGAMIGSMGGMIGTQLATAIGGPIGGAIFGTAITAFGMIKSHFDKKKEEELKKLKDELAKYEESLSNMEGNKDSAERYDELANGVDNLGRNISLTSEEYEEFLKLGNELAEVYPSLVDGTDGFGNSLLKVNGVIGGITQEIPKLVKEMQKLSYQKIFEKKSGTSIAQDLLNDYKKETKEFSKNNYAEILDQLNLNSFDSSGALKMFINNGKQQSAAKDIINYLKQNGVESAEYKNTNGTQYMSVSSEEADKAQKLFKNWKTQQQNDFTLNDQKMLNEYFDQVLPAIVSLSGASISEDQQRLLSNMVTKLKIGDKSKFKNADAVFDFIKTNMLPVIANEDFSTNLENLVNIDQYSSTLGDFETNVQNATNAIKQNFKDSNGNWTEEFKNILTAMGYDIATFQEEDFNQVIDQWLSASGQNNVTKITSEALTSKLEQISGLSGGDKEDVQKDVQNLTTAQAQALYKLDDDVLESTLKGYSTLEEAWTHLIDVLNNTQTRSVSDTIADITAELKKSEKEIKDIVNEDGSINTESQTYQNLSDDAKKKIKELQDIAENYGQTLQFILDNPTQFQGIDIRGFSNKNSEQVEKQFENYQKIYDDLADDGKLSSENYNTASQDSSLVKYLTEENTEALYEYLSNVVKNKDGAMIASAIGVLMNDKDWFDKIKDRYGIQDEKNTFKSASVVEEQRQKYFGILSNNHLTDTQKQQSILEQFAKENGVDTSKSNWGKEAKDKFKAQWGIEIEDWFKLLQLLIDDEFQGNISEDIKIDAQLMVDKIDDSAAKKKIQQQIQKLQKEAKGIYDINIGLNSYAQDGFISADTFMTMTDDDHIALLKEQGNSSERIKNIKEDLAENYKEQAKNELNSIPDSEKQSGAYKENEHYRKALGYQRAINMLDDVDWGGFKQLRKDAEKEAKQLKKTVRDFNDQMKDFAKQERLNELNSYINRQTEVKDNFTNMINSLKTAAEDVGNDSYLYQFDKVNEKFDLMSQKGNVLKETYDKISQVIPQTADEAKTQADQMSTLTSEIVENIREQRALADEQNNLLLNSFNSAYDTMNTLSGNTHNVITQLSNRPKQNNNILGNNYYNMLLNLPDYKKVEDNVEKKKKENEEILKLEKENSEARKKVMAEYFDFWDEEQAYQLKKSREDARDSYQQTLDDFKEKYGAIVSLIAEDGTVAWNDFGDAAVSNIKDINTELKNALELLGQFGDPNGKGKQDDKDGDNTVTSQYGTKSNPYNIPKGATVYMNSKSDPKNGHVGIYDGNGGIYSNEAGIITHKKIEDMLNGTNYSFQSWGYNGGKELTSEQADELIKNIENNIVTPIKGYCQKWVADIYQSVDEENIRYSRSSAKKAGKVWGTHKEIKQVVNGDEKSVAFVGYAHGTSYHKGGPAIVGDEGIGKYEAVVYPNGDTKILGQRGAELVNLPRGTQIIPHDKTKLLLAGEAGNIPKYAGGTLGEISAKYESGGVNPGAISDGVGDYGGVSYGTVQFSTNTGSAQNFANWVVNNYDWASALDGKQAGTKAFNEAWKSIANNFAEQFEDAQQLYAWNNFYQPLADKIYKHFGIDMNRSRALQEMLISRGAQQNGQVITNMYAAGINSDMSDQEIIQAYYATLRNNTDSYFKSSSPEIRKSLKEKRFVTEEQDLLNLLGIASSSVYDLVNIQKIIEKYGSWFDDAIAKSFGKESYQKSVQNGKEILSTGITGTGNSYISEALSDGEIMTEGESEPTTNEELYRALIKKQDVRKRKLALESNEQLKAFINDANMLMLKDRAYYSNIPMAQSMSSIQYQEKLSKQSVEITKNEIKEFQDMAQELIQARDLAIENGATEEQVTQYNESIQKILTDIADKNEKLIEYQNKVSQTIVEETDRITNKMDSLKTSKEDLINFGNIIDIDKMGELYKTLVEEQSNTYNEIHANRLKQEDVLRQNGVPEGKWLEDDNYKSLVNAERTAKNNLKELPSVYKQLIMQLKELDTSILEAKRPQEWSNMSQIKEFYETKQAYLKEEIKLAEDYLNTENLSLTEQKQAYEDYLNKMKEARQLELDRLNDEIDLRKKVYEALRYQVNEYITAINEEKDQVTKKYDKEIEKLQKVNESKERSIKLTELENNLQKAKDEKKRVYRQGVGWVYESDREAVQKAQQDLDSFYRQDRITDLQNAKQAELDVLQERIDGWNNYLTAMEKVYNTAEREEHQRILKEYLGADTLEEMHTLLAKDRDEFLMKFNDTGKLNYVGQFTKCLDELNDALREHYRLLREGLNVQNFNPIQWGENETPNWREYAAAYNIDDFQAVLDDPHMTEEIMKKKYGVGRAGMQYMRNAKSKDYDEYIKNNVYDHLMGILNGDIANDSNFNMDQLKQIRQRWGSYLKEYNGNTTYNERSQKAGEVAEYPDTNNTFLSNGDILRIESTDLDKIIDTISDIHEAIINGDTGISKEVLEKALERKEQINKIILTIPDINEAIINGNDDFSKELLQKALSIKEKRFGDALSLDLEKLLELYQNGDYKNTIQLDEESMLAIITQKQELNPEEQQWNTKINYKTNAKNIANAVNYKNIYGDDITRELYKNGNINGLIYNINPETGKMPNMKSIHDVVTTNNFDIQITGMNKENSNELLNRTINEIQKRFPASQTTINK